MRSKYVIGPILAIAVTLPTLLAGLETFSIHQPGYTHTFMLEECEGFSSTGQNPFFILEPGYQLIFDGAEDGQHLHLTITVLNETQTIDGIETRVVEERETQNGELAEVSRNYFALCNRTNSVVYFGEDVDFYENGVIVSHEGAWRAGVKGARAGIVMPGTVFLGARYYQEIAPEVALDRAEIVSLSEVVQTPAGTFEKCLKTRETTPLEPGTEEFKWYAPGVGLVQDGDVKLERIESYHTRAELAQGGVRNPMHHLAADSAAGTPLPSVVLRAEYRRSVP
jgi:hypothetical protein